MPILPNIQRLCGQMTGCQLRLPYRIAVLVLVGSGFVT